MDLLESVRRYVLKELPYEGSNSEIVAALNAKSHGDLLILYLNWVGRLIKATPRQVLTSACFDKSLIACQWPDAISGIIADIENGRVLTKFLSKRIMTGFELAASQKKNLQKLSYLDLLLNDWGVHHLHISTSVEQDGFVGRSGPLLFAIFTASRAYLIDIRNHHNFADDSLMRIVADTWPDEGIIKEVKGVLPGRNPPTNEERAKLRSVGVLIPLQIDGRVFFSNSSMTSAGTSIKAAHYAQQILETLKAFEEQWRLSPDKLIQTARGYGVDLSDRSDFEFEFFVGGFGVVETKSRTPIGLGVLNCL